MFQFSERHHVSAAAVSVRDTSNLFQIPKVLVNIVLVKAAGPLRMKNIQGSCSPLLFDPEGRRTEGVFRASQQPELR